MTRLSQLKVGEWAVVKAVEGAPAIRRRLETMGFVPNVRVQVSRAAPLGDPRAYELLGYCLSLRQEEAALVIVEPLKVFQLSAAPNSRLRVVDVVGGWGMKRRLTQLGIVEGIVLTRLEGAKTGPVMVEIQGRKFPIGRGMAAKILVMVEEDVSKTSD